MVQGTASGVGKSTVVAALCRIFRQDGLKVAPFKAQNMSLNSYVTPEGGEIGRAQAVQAEAASIEPSVEMNPILLKPEADSRSQIVVLGRPMQSAEAREYFKLKPQLWQVVTQSLDKLMADYDMVVIEGAGSPAEINLKQDEIVNMRVASYARAPVLLVGDIDRGGVFASLVGTLELLDDGERGWIKAFVINKFRGDMAILEPGLRWLEERTGISIAGVLPYFQDIHIAEEDSVALKPHVESKNTALLDIAVICLPHIANFDDFDSLEREEGVRLRYVDGPSTLGHPDLIILPGSKTTVADLEHIKESGLAQRIIRLAQDGTYVIGVCGGYQMLGERIHDPDHVESSEGEVEGLGLLNMTTTFYPHKETHRVRGRVVRSSGLLQQARDIPFEGYEIHMGRTTGEGISSPFLIEERRGQPCQRLDGGINAGGNVLGTYIHGLFDNQRLRQALLEELASKKGLELSFNRPQPSKEEQYDKLAALVRGNLDMKLIYWISGLSLKAALK